MGRFFRLIEMSCGENGGGGIGQLVSFYWRTCVWVVESGDERCIRIVF